VPTLELVGLAGQPHNGLAGEVLRGKALRGKALATVDSGFSNKVIE
jgi:hypothetical protein